MVPINGTTGLTNRKLRGTTAVFNPVNHSMILKCLYAPVQSNPVCSIQRYLHISKTNCTRLFQQEIEYH